MQYNSTPQKNDTTPYKTEQYNQIQFKTGRLNTALHKKVLYDKASNTWQSDDKDMIVTRTDEELDNKEVIEEGKTREDDRAPVGLLIGILVEAILAAAVA